jgi:hypothetical protein
MVPLEDPRLFSTLTVTNLQDSGACSLRGQIGSAASGDTIVFAPTLFSTTATSGSSGTLSAALRTTSTKGTNKGKGHGGATSPPLVKRAERERRGSGC